MRLKEFLSSASVGALGAAAILVATAASRPSRGSEVIDVGRINIREPDGTLRLIISNAALQPGIIHKGQEQPHPNRRSAGILFYNDEGTETGGLSFSGGMLADGSRSSSGGLSFDRYEQDQVVQLSASEHGGQRGAGLAVNDQSEQSFDYAALDRVRSLPTAERGAAVRAAHAGGRSPRPFPGRLEDGSSAVMLKDAAGHDRLILRVEQNGSTSIRFLDAAGRETRRIDG